MNLFLATLAITYVYATDLEGHMQPLGMQRKSEGHIEVLADIPDAVYFFNNYIKSSKPAVLKGAAKRIPAFQKWNDEYMRENFGELKCDVEEGKKENRSLEMWQWNYKKFLQKYKSEDIYMVNSLEKKMKEDLRFLPLMSCGGFGNVLMDIAMWFSSGGTKSVLHNDHIDNINCLFSGTKTLWMSDYKYREHIDFDATNGAYSNVDVDAVDLNKYPGLSKAPWWEANMESGDCLFIPARWFHEVRSFVGNDDRNMAVNVWFYNMKKINVTDCEKSEYAGKYAPLKDFTVKDIEAVRFVLALEVEKEPLHFKEMAQRLRVHAGGDYLRRNDLKQLLRILDVDQDKYISIEDLKQLSDEELTHLSNYFPGLEQMVEEEEEEEVENHQEVEETIDNDKGSDESLPKQEL